MTFAKSLNSSKPGELVFIDNKLLYTLWDGHPSTSSAQLFGPALVLSNEKIEFAWKRKYRSGEFAVKSRAFTSGNLRWIDGLYRLKEAVYGVKVLKGRNIYMHLYSPPYILGLSGSEEKLP